MSDGVHHNREAQRHDSHIVDDIHHCSRFAGGASATAMMRGFEASRVGCGVATAVGLDWSGIVSSSAVVS